VWFLISEAHLLLVGAVVGHREGGVPALLYGAEVEQHGEVPGERVELHEREHGEREHEERERRGNMKRENMEREHGEREHEEREHGENMKRENMERT